MIIIHATCKDQTEADMVSRLILEHKLAAVVHKWPTHALYASAHGIHEMHAYYLLIQTLETKLQAIEEVIEQARSYTTPFVGTVDVRRVNHAYKERVAAILH